MSVELQAKPNTLGHTGRSYWHTAIHMDLLTKNTVILNSWKATNVRNHATPSCLMKSVSNMLLAGHCMRLCAPAP